MPDILPNIPSVDSQAPDIPAPYAGGVVPDIPPPVDTSAQYGMLAASQPAISQSIQQQQPVIQQARPQPQTDADRAKQILMGGLEYFNKRMQALTQPKGAWQRFREGAGGALLHSAGLQTPDEQMLAAAREFQGLAPIGNDIISNDRLNRGQELMYGNTSVRLPDGSIITGPQKHIDQIIRSRQSDINNQRSNDTRMKLEQTKLAIQQGQIAKWMPVNDGQGNVIMRGFNRQGQPIQDVDEAVFPWLMQNTSSTTEHIQGADGTWYSFPKTTVSSKQVPGARGSGSVAPAPGSAPVPRQGSGSAAPVPRQVGGIQARPIIGPDNQPLIGAPSNMVERGYDFNSKQLETAAKPIEDSLGRFGRLVDTINQKTAQADSLVAPELLTVMAGGTGSGLRMNEAEISRIIGGRDKLQDLQAALNKWTPGNGLSVTDEQRSQINKLINVVNDRLATKQNILDEARESLINASSVKEQRQIVADTRKKLAGADIQSPGQAALDTARNQATNANIRSLRTGNAAPGTPPPPSGDMIQVQAPGAKPGYIHKSQLAAFKSRYPKGKVLSGQ